ncbi:receptor-like protein EIX2 [Aristolochia californica]|uniref:receptor-like protein EIX2 n=1 Tax=Aristolochia californica TaxID=171875 RepID=UPI0035E058A2
MKQQGKGVSVEEMRAASIVGFLLLGILCKGISSSQVGCFDVEREALTKFRSKLIDPSNLLTSWDDSPDCCKWDGVTCDSETGYVIQLSLFPGGCSGQIDAALLQLKHLRHLDLSWNSFYGVKIPDFFCSFMELRYLDLSSAGFSGKFPFHLANITALVSIDLRGNDLYGEISSEFTALPHLEEFYLSFNEDLRVNCSNLFGGSWKNIKVMDLAGVQLYGEIPKSIGNMTTLTSLKLGVERGNRTMKGFLSQMGNLHNLEFLSLTGFEDSILSKLNWLCSLTNLTNLSITDSRFSGHVPTCLGELSSLRHLTIRNSMLQGFVLEKHFQNLSKLISLELSLNSLEFRLPIDWVPLFQLGYLDLGSCRLGPQFPLWLQTQRQLKYLDLSHTSVHSIPSWLWNITSELQYLNLSMNNISGSLANITLANYTDVYIDLSHNKFTGLIPFLTNSFTFFDISYNQFCGVIPSQFGKMKGLEILNLSHNNLTGGVPPTLANCGSLKVLDLKANYLSGNISWSSIQFVNIQCLHLEKNKLSGEFPSFLKNCTDLQILDLSGNEFSGSLPSWIGVRLSSLRILQLRSNMFIGTIPELWNLGYLQILDVSHNRLTGAIPRGITNLTAMRINLITNNTLNHGGNYYQENADVAYNGIVYEFTTTLFLVITLDLSSNNLSGTILEEVGNLIGLIALNLSGNQFFGKIPESIGKLHRLINLDLSRNHLSGSIPLAIASLTFLNHLNLSYNNLFGIIPSGNQLDTLNEESIYVGNEGLCGYPLRKDCKSDGRDQIPAQLLGDEEFEDKSEMRWIYAGIAPGFTFGLMVCKIGFVGILSDGSEMRWTYVGIALCSLLLFAVLRFMVSHFVTRIVQLTVACFPLMGGVLELGVTELFSEDLALIQQITTAFLEFPKLLCYEQSTFSPRNVEKEDNQRR